MARGGEPTLHVCFSAFNGCTNAGHQLRDRAVLRSHASAGRQDGAVAGLMASVCAAIAGAEADVQPRFCRQAGGFGSWASAARDCSGIGWLAVLALAWQGLFLLEDAQEGPQAVGRRDVASRICTEGIQQQCYDAWQAATTGCWRMQRLPQHGLAMW